MGSQSDLGKLTSSGKVPGTGGVIFLILFSLPFAGLGIVALVQGVSKWSAGNTHDGPILCLIGFIFALVGFSIMAGAIAARRKLRQKADLEARFPGKPWFIRPDWTAGKIKASTMDQPKAYLFMGIAFAVVGGASTYFGLPEVWHKHNYAALAVLLFPLAGLGLLIAFIRGWRSQRRFGACFFKPAQVPIPIGGVLEGMIQTGKPLKLENELHLKFACFRRSVTGSGEDRKVSEYQLWQSAKVYSKQANLPSPEPYHTGIPIYFKLPADQPECFSGNNESVLWRLEARTKMSGPDFHAVFELPVFNVPGAARPEGEIDADPTAALQVPMEEVRRNEKSRIQVFDGPNGREFYFPPARNIGPACSLTVTMLVFNSIAVTTHYLHAPLLFPVLFGLVGILLILCSLNIWTKSTRVTINSTDLCATTRWLIFSRSRKFRAGDVARFETKNGMQVGSNTFLDIKLIPNGSDEKFAADRASFQAGGASNMSSMARFREAAGPSGVTVASSIANAAEANWLVDEMNKALGR